MKIHIDFDSYFASAEIARHQELTNLPVAVYGGEDDNPMILAATYEAKSCGVFTTQRMKQAKALCPELICFRSDLAYYKELSVKAKEFFQEQIPVLEQYSIDEFFGDLSGYIKEQDTLKFLQDLQLLTLEKLHLRASFGASTSKWSAKLLTTLAKPFGIKVAQFISQELKNVQIEHFPGIGKHLSKKLKAHGISTLDQAILREDLFNSSLEKKIFLRICGNDNEAVNATQEHKSIGASSSFRAHSDYDKLLICAAKLADELNTQILKSKQNPSTLILNFRARFASKSKTIRLSVPFCFSQVRTAARQLAINAFEFAPVYHLGLSAGNFVKSTQMDLFKSEKAAKQEKLNQVLAKYPDLATSLKGKTCKKQR